MNKLEVAARLREVVDKHGGRAAFVKLIGKSPQTLTDYLTGKTLPGTRMRAAMRAIGVDDNYIMYGSSDPPALANAATPHEDTTMRNKEIAARLREVAEQFGGPARFAERLGIPKQSLNVYISEAPRALPGNKMRARLRAAGIDDNYIMYGSSGPSALANAATPHEDTTMRNKEIAARLREVAEQFGGTSALAEKFGVKPQGLSPYLSGRIIPGNKMRERLRAIGVDDYYIMHGVGTLRLPMNFLQKLRRRLIATGFMRPQHRGTIVCPNCKHEIPMNPIQHTKEKPCPDKHCDTAPNS